MTPRIFSPKIGKEAAANSDSFTSKKPKKEDKPSWNHTKTFLRDVSKFGL